MNINDEMKRIEAAYRASNGLPELVGAPLSDELPEARGEVGSQEEWLERRATADATSEPDWWTYEDNDPEWIKDHG